MDSPQQTSSTHFASAHRAAPEQLQAAHQTIVQTEFVQNLIQSVQDLVLILNEHRQIVAVNDNFLEALGIHNVAQLLGKRPGEALNCASVASGPNGCGTAEVCSVCGAVLTILASQESHQRAKGECRVTLEKDGGTALDLAVMASPLEVEGHHFTIFSLRDISSDQRRQVLERVFFHDILNTAGGIRGIASLLTEELPENKELKFKQWMVGLSDSLIEDINHQRRLMAAERGDYRPLLEPVDLPELLYELACLYEHHDRTPNRTTCLREQEPCTLVTDRTILRRIVGNMIMNALEASPAGSTITIGSVRHDDMVRVEVQNPGEIPKEVQLQLFKRSFTTKGMTGRGIGTYSMKLFGERYLGGKTGFSSANGQTTFFIDLPLSAATV